MGWFVGVILGESGARENEETDIEVAILPEQCFKKPLVIHTCYLFRNVEGNPIFLHESNLRVGLAAEARETSVDSDFMTDAFEEGEINRQQHNACNTGGSIHSAPEVHIHDLVMVGGVMDMIIQLEELGFAGEAQAGLGVSFQA